ncbi:unnamed protein product [Rotaria sordida]|uniref:Protein kinase domain-containing protein n=1 Tax=Rotaria sordida TaxID=392033 RepID=A0A819SBJ4_9BILA|nr:unnamed protein product [Rotaria sordida]CAF1256613.1 unnamed protein product [Rotaria sordida]CAF4056863.1 unnamed protein product [Rotaria sordida]CAF4088633.1 unnamed protein product [Rotaria sordida]
MHTNTIKDALNSSYSIIDVGESSRLIKSEMHHSEIVRDDEEDNMDYSTTHYRQQSIVCQTTTKDERPHRPSSNNDRWKRRRSSSSDDGDCRRHYSLQSVEPIDDDDDKRSLKHKTREHYQESTSVITNEYVSTTIIEEENDHKQNHGQTLSNDLLKNNDQDEGESGVPVQPIYHRSRFDDDDEEEDDRDHHYKRSLSYLSSTSTNSLSFDEEEQKFTSIDTHLKLNEHQQLNFFLNCPTIRGCRYVDEYQFLSHIGEGTYGTVFRARERKTGKIVALKRLKIKTEQCFPITFLREIYCSSKSQHENIIIIREVLVGNHLNQFYMVMDYVEHDLKSLMTYTMQRPFSIGEVKTLMLQLLSGVNHLHNNWIIHRDLKTANLLLNNQGILKIGDFGLAREYSTPLKPYTPLVVTLWYRAPELLLGIKEYSTAIDIWSVGAIFGELLLMAPLFPGQSEMDQLNAIFKDLGTPNTQIWPEYNTLPLTRKISFTNYPYNRLQARFDTTLSKECFDLLNKFLIYDPSKRISAEAALKHQFFYESPCPIDRSMFPTWSSRNERKDKINHVTH